MKYPVILLGLLFVTGALRLSGQNLVPNPGFESETPIHCGIYGTQDLGNSIPNWASASQGTPDLFSTTIDPVCWNHQPTSAYSGPIGLKGPQLPKSGNNMAGLFCYTIQGFDQREYIQTQLTTPLTVGGTYRVAFFASLADNTELSTYRLGAYLSTTQLAGVTDDVMVHTPHLEATNFVSDTSGWTLVVDTITVTDAYKFITIGNFRDDSMTPTQANPGGGNGAGLYGAYYFIDEVSVTPVLTVGTAAPQALHLEVYPQPAQEQLYVKVDVAQAVRLDVYDLGGQVVRSHEFVRTGVVDLRGLPAGLYLYRLQGSKGVMGSGKFVKMGGQ